MSFLNQIVKEEFYNPATTLGAVFYALVFFGIAWVLGRLLKFAVTRAVRHEQSLVDRMAAPFLAQLARMAAYIVLLLIYVHLVPQLRSLGTALLTGVSVVSIVIAAAWYVHRLNREVSELLPNNQDCMVAGQRLVLGIRDARLRLHQFIETGDEGNLQEIVAIEPTTSQHLRDADQSATTDEIRELIGRTRRNHDQFFAELTDVTRDTPPAQRQQKVRELTEAFTTNVLAPAEELLERTQQTSAHHTERNRVMAESIGLGLLVLGACGAVGGLMAGFGIARGIAKRVEQSEREATRSEQLAAIGQLAAGLAHELRNPLMAMRLLVEAGREQTGGDTLDQRDLEVLDEEIARLEKLVESFLDFARPPKLEKTKLDARSLVEKTLHLVSGPARQRGVTIDWQPPAEAVAIEADPVQMRQVLLNLLLNALDGAGEGGKVTVELKEEAGTLAARTFNPSRETRQTIGSGNPSYSSIQISDDGPGVPSDMREKIFEPFVSSKETGLGLGLAVSRRIVEAHGGAITVDDNPNGGARFTIWLPMERNDE